MAAPSRVVTHVRLRVERGERGPVDDHAVELFRGDASPPWTWTPAEIPGPAVWVLHERRHVSADEEHILLEERCWLEGGDVHFVSALLLEGHWMGRLGESLAEHPHQGPVGQVVRSLGQLADRAVKQAHEVVDIYQDPKLRRQFANAIRHPHLLTRRMQRSLLFLVLLSSLWVWIVGLTLLAMVAPRFAVPWNLAFSLYGASLGTNLFLPIPVEPLVLASVGSLGAGVAIGACAAGKAVGAWIIFALGPALRAGMQRLEARSAVTRAVMARAERFARRFGYLALGALLAIPFSPFDIIPVYLFGSLGLRLGPFLAAVALGFGLRLAAVVWLGQALLGLPG